MFHVLPLVSYMLISSNWPLFEDRLWLRTARSVGPTGAIATTGRVVVKIHGFTAPPELAFHCTMVDTTPVENEKADA
jgi:hypothetical protein